MMTKIQTPETQAATSPSAAVAMLIEGNERFLSGEAINRDYQEQVMQTAGEQPATIQHFRLGKTNK